jgi:hypothetical protein
VRLLKFRWIDFAEGDSKESPKAQNSERNLAYTLPSCFAALAYVTARVWTTRSNCICSRRCGGLR